VVSIRFRCRCLRGGKTRVHFHGFAIEPQRQIGSGDKETKLMFFISCIFLYSILTKPNEMHKCKYSKTDYKTHFLASVVSYMSWHQGAIIREFITIKALLVQHVCQALSALTYIIRVKSFKCQNSRLHTNSICTQCCCNRAGSWLCGGGDLYTYTSIVGVYNQSCNVLKLLRWKWGRIATEILVEPTKLFWRL
jgi:hypothetical protein